MTEARAPTTEIDEGAIALHYASLLPRLRGVALYGSRARGDARPDSDIDLFLVADDLPADLFDRSALLVPPPRAVRSGLSVSARALTPDEWKRDLSPLDLDVALDAKILLDRGGYLAEHLALVRKRIEEAGLVRDPHLVWRWKKTPSSRAWKVGWDEVRV